MRYAPDNSQINEQTSVVRALMESRYDGGTHVAWGQEKLALGVGEPSVGKETRKAGGSLRFRKGAT